MNVDENGEQHEYLGAAAADPQGVDRADARGRARNHAAGLLDCVMTIRQPFITPIYDFTAPCIVFGRVAMVGDAAANARPHMGFGVAKAGGDAQALAAALRDHDDIDTALKAYNAERQPIGNIIVQAQPQAWHPSRRQFEDRGRPPHARALAKRRGDDGLDRGAEFSG